MRLTKRCMDLLRLLRVARWLTTSQIRRRFFTDASLDAARRRLRKLAAGRYVAMAQPNRMTEALFTLGREGQRVLKLQEIDGEIALERRPPKQIEHLIGINDIRIAAELAGDLDYFFACWELPRLGWQCAVIPDAVFSISDRTYAMEFDRGDEGLQFFLRTKIPGYAHGFSGFICNAVLIVTERRARMESLARAIGVQNTAFLYSTVDLIRDRSFKAEIFYEMSGEGLLSRSLVDTTVLLSQVPEKIKVAEFGDHPIKEGEKPICQKLP